MLNPFLEDMGCIEISRQKFITLQKQALAIELPQDFWLPRQLTL